MSASFMKQMGQSSIIAGVVMLGVSYGMRLFKR